MVLLETAGSSSSSLSELSGAARLVLRPVLVLAVRLDAALAGVDLAACFPFRGASSSSSSPSSPSSLVGGVSCIDGEKMPSLLTGVKGEFVVALEAADSLVERLVDEAILAVRDESQEQRNTTKQFVA